MKMMTKNDNPPGQSSALILAFIASKGIKMFEHTPHSPNLAPCNFWLLTRLKSELTGKKHNNLEEV